MWNLAEYQKELAVIDELLPLGWGRPRIHQELKRRGFNISRHRVYWLIVEKRREYQQKLLEKSTTECKRGRGEASECSDNNIGSLVYGSVQ